MLQDVEQGQYDKDVNDLEARLQEKTKAYNESQWLLQSFWQGEEKWEKRLEDGQAKAKDISIEKKYLQDTLDTVFLHQKGLENEVSDLTDELVSVVKFCSLWDICLTRCVDNRFHKIHH